MGMNDNTMNKQETQKRILIATLISFVFFIAYDFLYLQPQMVEQKKVEQQKKEEQAKQNNVTNTVSTPEVQNAEKAAPSIATAQTKNTAPEVKNLTNNDIVSTIKTKNSIIEIDTLGRIAQVTILSNRFDDQDGKHIKLFNKAFLRPLEVRFADGALNSEAFKTGVAVNAKELDATNGPVTLTMTQKLSNTTLTKTLKIYPEGHYDLDIKTSNEQNLFITPGFRPDVLADMYADHGALLVNADGTLNIIEDEDMERNAEFVGIRAISQFDRYYATALYNFDKNMQVTVMKNSANSPESFIHVLTEHKFKGYMGPKEYKTLEELDPQLVNIIEYGWFTFLAKPMFWMLQAVYAFVGSWGWTIVVTTILIKIILFPLSHKGMIGMNRLKELAPKIKAIQEKYGNDKQKASTHMMELYKKEGANPMGGCLPILLQIPVFFAIYRVLLNAIELKGSEWLYITDLAEMDPYFILPILMGASMYFQQKITPNQIQDEMQRKVFQLLPVVFTVFFLWFPAGLVLYWLVNNLFTIAHQYYINQMFEKAKEVRHQEHMEQKNKNKKGK
jgi:YidC/Oxa1 family membrane protein insertase